jgi:hypothetical protein
LIGVTTNDPHQPRAFPTFSQYMDECDAKGEPMSVPKGCYTERRTAKGKQLLVNEERYQELQRRPAEAKENTVMGEATEEKTAKQKAAEEKTVKEEAAEEEVAKAC